MFRVLYEDGLERGKKRERLKRSKTQARALSERERESAGKKKPSSSSRNERTNERTNERFYLDDDVRREELHLKESFHSFHSFIHSFIHSSAGQRRQRESTSSNRTQTNIKHNKRNMAQSALVVYLRKLLRVVNYLLLFYGLAIVVVSAELYFEWTKERDSDETFKNHSLVDPETGERLSYKEIAEKEPVFLYLFFAIGLYVTMVSWTGLWGVESPRNRCCLPFYAHNLLFMWMCSIVFVGVAFSEKARDFVGAEHEHSIKDITGATKKMYDTMSENLFVVQIMSLLLVFVQTTSLVLTAALRRAVSEYSSSAFEESDDEDEGEAESLFFGNKNRNQNSSGGSANFRDVESGHSGGVGENDDDDDDESWSERMKLKYGVDVSKYAHSPARPPPSHNKKKKYPGQSNPELAEKANFCGVM